MSLSIPLPELSARVRVRVEAVPEHGAFDLDALPADERARLVSFANAERRRQFILGRLAARRLLGHQLELAPADVLIGVEASGALRVEQGFLSIAHAGRGHTALGLAAFANAPVGIDAELVRPRHPGLGRRILRSDETDVLDALDSGTDSSLTLVWALKEAVLKGQQTGLRAGSQSVRLSIRTCSEAGGTATALSDRSGQWELSFVRQRDLWVAVALAKSDSA